MFLTSSIHSSLKIEALQELVNLWWKMLLKCVIFQGNDASSKLTQNKKRKVKRKNSNDAADAARKPRTWDCENFDQNYEQINSDLIKYARLKPKVGNDGKCAKKAGKQANKPDELDLILNRESIINDIKTCLSGCRSSCKRQNPMSSLCFPEFSRRNHAEFNTESPHGIQPRPRHILSNPHVDRRRICLQSCWDRQVHVSRAPDCALSSRLQS